jgi:spore coat polysaccharide biosynthesis protein SpsF
MLAIVQARMTSTRLPGKVLMPMAGKPMIRWVYDRLSRASRVTKIVIATSNSSSDDLLCEYCSRQNIPYFRGSLQGKAGCDLATNVLVRSYPRGQSVEVIRTAALVSAHEKISDAADREHVTRYFYTHFKQFRIRSFSTPEFKGDIQLSVDTLSDFKSVELIIENAGADVSWKTAAALKSVLAT